MLDRHLKGAVFGFDGLGLAETTVMVFEKSDVGRHRLLALGATTEKGEYRLSFSGVGIDKLFCCFFKDGFELSILTVDKAPSLDHQTVDAILAEAIPVTIRVRNKLGFSLSGLGIKVSSSANVAFPIAYSTDRQGMVHTQSIFREDGRYQVSITSGGVELYAEEFIARVSKQLEIVLPAAGRRSAANCPRKLGG